MSQRATLSSLLLGAMLMGTSLSAAAQSAYSDRSIEGAYGFIIDGTIQGLPSVAVGRIVYDGGGGCVAIGWLNLGGVTFPLSTGLAGGSCTYAVTAEGLYTATLVGIAPDGSPAPFDHRGVVVHDDSNPQRGEILFSRDRITDRRQAVDADLEPT